MWVADKWRDYELLDCSGGEKLERWGKYLLIRPDPQAIWHTSREHVGWKNHHARYSRQKGDGKWEKSRLPESWGVDYGDMRFNVKPMSFKHTGIFPEQAANWDFVQNQIRQSNAEKPVSVLNLFAYTGAATIAAALAGAEVCHVDAARGMVNWARENANASNAGDLPIRWIVDDCKAFVEREIRRGRRYDAIIMDPPSFGRGPSGELWKLEDDLWSFVSLCTGILSDTPLFVLISSYTAGLAPSVLTYISESIFTKRFGGSAECAELGIPVTESGLYLPCGASSRWTSGR